MRRTILIAGLLTLLTGLVPAGAVQAAPNNNSSPKLRAAVTVSGVLEHQQAFQAIADANGGTRLAGTPGYDESAEYVAGRMEAAGYRVTLQPFEFLLVGDGSPPILERLTPPGQSFTDGTDFDSMTYSGSGDTTAGVWAVDLVVPSPFDNASTSGCDAADFAGFAAGSIALLQRGTCNFSVKADNAAAAGASGVIIFNEGNPGRTGVIDGTLSPPLRSLPVVGTTFAVGDNLRNGVQNGPTGVDARLRVDSVAETRTTVNVIAETPEGAADNVVVVGAHLDSVSRGPGINDNGSGSATILEIAEEMSKVKPRNQVRFIWFGAEELGLIGSTFYVNSLSPAERGNIALMLNFDMVGSPNFVRFVYDGDTSHTTPPAGGAPAGSAQIEQLFVDYFAAQGLEAEPTAFDGRSDYGPFIAVGIPAGGLFTGAEGIKTPAQQAVYGGVAGQPYDPCYHLACDTIANLSVTALDQMSDAVAHAVISYAQSTAPVNGKRGKGNFNTAERVNLQAER
ncbi:MAG TPA: M28 family metallopeptidase [Actinomycetota bacterium]|nr:M28 family metallopeptidase [Actinomycetota bacterium]